MRLRLRTTSHAEDRMKPATVLLIAAAGIVVALAAAARIGSGEEDAEARTTRPLRAATSTPVATAAPWTTITAPMTTRPPSYSSEGVYSVGTVPTGGARDAIPPGRYTITMRNPALEAVVVIRCSAFPCSAGENFIAGDGGYGGDYTGVIDILDTDGAVRLTNARLTPVE